MMRFLFHFSGFLVISLPLAKLIQLAIKKIVKNGESFKDAYKTTISIGVATTIIAAAIGALMPKIPYRIGLGILLMLILGYIAGIFICFKTIKMPDGEGIGLGKSALISLVYSGLQIFLALIGFAIIMALIITALGGIHQGPIYDLFF